MCVRSCTCMYCIERNTILKTKWYTNHLRKTQKKREKKRKRKEKNPDEERESANHALGKKKSFLLALFVVDDDVVCSLAAPHIIVL